MEIRIRNTGAIISERELRRMHPNTSLPKQLTEAVLDSLGADVVLEGPQASGGTRYQYSQRSGVEQINGKWYTRYVLGPTFTDTTDENGVVTTAAEHQAAYEAGKDAEHAAGVRSDRNKRLADTDWTQVADAPVDKAAWATYRQALRDITSQAGFPWDVTWPDQPL